MEDSFAQHFKTMFFRQRTNLRYWKGDYKMGTLKFQQLSSMNCHYARHSFPYFLDRTVENGLSSIELWAEALYVEQSTRESLKTVKRMLEERGMKLVCFTPEVLGHPFNIAMKDPELRARSVAFVKRGIEIAAELNSPKMLIVSGWGDLDDSREEAMKRSLDSIAELSQKAEAEGVVLALEHLSPISSNLVNTAMDLKNVLDTIRSPALKAMMDTCQMGLVHETVEDYLKLLGENLIHIHLVDGTPGGHLAFGDGNLPLKSITETLGEYGYGQYLSMEIADRRYFAHPELADRQSIAAFREWIHNQ